jgi:hypothetical protein
VSERIKGKCPTTTRNRVQEHNTKNNQKDSDKEGATEGKNSICSPQRVAFTSFLLPSVCHASFLRNNQSNLRSDTMVTQCIPRMFVFFLCFPVRPYSLTGFLLSFLSYPPCLLFPYTQHNFTQQKIGTQSVHRFSFSSLMLVLVLIFPLQLLPALCIYQQPPLSLHSTLPPSRSPALIRLPRRTADLGIPQQQQQRAY